jgi:hypothetical protein
LEDEYKIYPYISLIGFKEAPSFYKKKKKTNNNLFFIAQQPN